MNALVSLVLGVSIEVDHIDVLLDRVEKRLEIGGTARVDLNRQMMSLEDSPDLAKVRSMGQPRGIIRPRFDQAKGCHEWLHAAKAREQLNETGCGSGRVGDGVQVLPQ